MSHGRMTEMIENGEERSIIQWAWLTSSESVESLLCEWLTSSELCHYCSLVVSQLSHYCVNGSLVVSSVTTVHL